MKKLVVIFLLALFIRVAIACIPTVRWWDEAVYGSLGWNLKSNPLDYSFKGFGDYVPISGFEQKAGFRAPLLPYALSFLYLFSGINSLNLFFIPVIGAIGVVALFLLTKEIFNEELAFYSSIFLSFLPLHVYYSGKILTDVFATTLITISFLFFWLGFQKNKKGFKILCGIFTGLAILARYVAILLLPIFLIYILWRKKTQLFKDKETLIAIFLGIVTISPLFFYSYNEYGNPLGAIIHASIAAAYFGGVQPWYYYFNFFPQMFSVLAFLLPIGLIFMFKEFKSSYLIVLIWFFGFLLFSIFLLSHKEDRFLLLLTPPLAIMSAYPLQKINYIFRKVKLEQIIFILIFLILLFSDIVMFLRNAEIFYTKENDCYLQGIEFLKTTESNATIFTDSSPIVYYYTHRKTLFIQNFKEIDNSYVFVNSYDGTIDKKFDFPIVFKCPTDGSLSQIYKISI